MAANAEARLTAPVNLEQTDVPATNTAAVATFAAGADSRNYVTVAILSATGTAPAAGSYIATLAFTQDGVAKSLSIALPAAAFAPVVLNFGSHPIEGDVNTAITLTVPALGAGAQSVAQLIGFVRAQ